VRLVGAHARAELLELIRYPSFSVPTLLFPALLFLFFGVSAEGADEAILMVSYAAFGVLGVALFQFGVGIATERTSPWQVYLRTLPVPARVRFAARLIAAAAFALASAGAVVAVALVLTSTELSASQWLRVGLALMYGTIPFGLLGLPPDALGRGRSAGRKADESAVDGVKTRGVLARAISMSLTTSGRSSSQWKRLSSLA
jgi:ABC-2 type transport system permease protein